MKYKLSYLILLIPFAIACNKEAKLRKVEIGKINTLSLQIFDNAKLKLNHTSNKIIIDSLTQLYTKSSKDSAELGLKFAYEIIALSNNLYRIRDSTITANEFIESEKVRATWEKTKAGKIQKKHPDWSNDDCISVSKGYYWIGMSIEMLKYQRGLPNDVNVSNYGNGEQYQWIWHDYTPSYFYGGVDGIVKSYN